jgi:hypothetical protein
VSVLLHPLVVGSQPILWRDWSRRVHRRACIQLLRRQRVEVEVQQGVSANPELAPAPLSRSQRAHTRLSWPERLARNRRAPGACQVSIKLYGVPHVFARWLGCRASE